MGYCGPKGIPLSKFLCWSQADQDAALAWQAHESRRCRSCGHHPEDGWPHAHLTVCPGCAQSEAVANDKGTKQTPGAHVRLSHAHRDECSLCR